MYEADRCCELTTNILKSLKKQVIHWDSIKEVGKDLKIVYTPLHGTGNIPARRVLKEIGFENVYVVTGAGTSGWRFPDSKLSKSGSRRSV